MSNFNMDNEGSGFMFDDDEPDDLKSMLASANAAEEGVGENDTFSYFVGEETAEEPNRAAPAPAAPEPEPEPEPQLEPAFSFDSDPSFDEPAVEEPPVEEHNEFSEPDFFQPPAFPEASTPEPEVAEPVEEEQVADFVEPIDSGYVPQDSYTQQFPQQPPRQEDPVSVPQEKKATMAPKLHIPSLADDIQRVRQVINILDVYRKLSKEEQMVASQFVANGEEVADEADFVVKVLNVDPMLAITMRALREAKDLDDVERSFFVIEIEDDVLYSLGSLVGVFLEEAADKSMGRHKYARQLVRDIQILDTKAMNFVTATESVLAAAEQES